MSDVAPERDREWLEDLFRRHHQAVLGYARRRVSLDEADDVLAEVFATAWKCRERVPTHALPWLYRTASHHVLHVIRGTGRRDRLADRFAAADRETRVEDHAETVADTLDEASRVRAALARLSPADAEILRLDAWEQLDGASLAYVLGCTRSTARVRLHRARRRFAEALVAHTDAHNPRHEVTT